MKPMLIGAAAVCAAVSLSTHVQAGTLVDTVKVEVSATVPPRCGFKQPPASMTSAPSIETAQSIALDFILDCNAPFAIGVQSSNGALAFQGTRDNSGFAFEKDYRVALSMATTVGEVSAPPCEAARLTATTPQAERCHIHSSTPGQGGLSSGEGFAVNEAGRVTVSWGSREGGQPRPAAGTYQDTLTIVLGVRS